MKWALAAVFMAFGLPLLMLAPVLGILADPFAPWRLSGQTGQISAAPAAPGVPVDPAVMPVTAGGVSDAFRYQLARLAGWSKDEAITMVAISIAENGAGNPTAMSGRNSNGTYDFGLLQINSAHWAEFDGQQALADPFKNFRAGHTIYGRQGWCAWSTYESSCGVGHTGAYRAYLNRAKVASDIQPIPGQT